MKKLQEIVNRCKGSVTVEVNPHKDIYMTPEAFLSEAGSDLDNTHTDVVLQMIANNTIVIVDFYPRTPVAFERVYHWDIDMAMDIVLSLLNDEVKWKE